ncbi:hypothetical protein MnBA_24860 [Marinobacterium sp. BA1]
MLDKSVLKQADTETLIETALECGRQQASILAHTETLTDEQIEELIEIEKIRDFSIRLIDWTDVKQFEDRLHVLQKLDNDNQVLLSTKRKALQKDIELLKKRRNVAGEYMNFR